VACVNAPKTWSGLPSLMAMAEWSWCRRAPKLPFSAAGDSSLEPGSGAHSGLRVRVLRAAATSGPSWWVCVQRSRRNPRSSGGSRAWRQAGGGLTGPRSLRFSRF